MRVLVAPLPGGYQAELLCKFSSALATGLNSRSTGPQWSCYVKGSHPASWAFDAVVVLAQGVSDEIVAARFYSLELAQEYPHRCFVSILVPNGSKRDATGRATFYPTFSSSGHILMDSPEFVALCLGIETSLTPPPTS
jgi:hypothetical protein